MRPRTLAEIANRFDEKPFSDLVAEFLDEFYKEETKDQAYAMVLSEPRLITPEIVAETANAELAAIAEYLISQYHLGAIPGWIRQPERILKEPLFTTISDSPEMKEYLIHASPAEFVNHNIFTDAEPLQRKRTYSPMFVKEKI